MCSVMIFLKIKRAMKERRRRCLNRVWGELLCVCVCVCVCSSIRVVDSNVELQS